MSHDICKATTALSATPSSWTNLSGRAGRKGGLGLPSNRSMRISARASGSSTGRHQLPFVESLNSGLGPFNLSCGRVAAVNRVPRPMNRRRAWMSAWAWSLRKSQPPSSLQGSGASSDQSTLFGISPCHQDPKGRSDIDFFEHAGGGWKRVTSFGVNESAS